MTQNDRIDAAIKAAAAAQRQALHTAIAQSTPVPR